MANDLVATDAQAAPTKSMTQLVISALADGFAPWQADAARRQIAAAGIDSAELLAELTAALAPVDPTRLVDRLKTLWKSSTPSGNLDAKTWLNETGRLLADLPEDILARAIDDAVKGSLRGFMPTVGEIRAIADPTLAECKRQEARMRVVVHGGLARPRYPWEPQERDIPPEELCSPEDARAIIRRFGIGASEGVAA